MMRSTIILSLIIFGASANAQRVNPHVAAGNKLYKENKFDKALAE